MKKLTRTNPKGDSNKGITLIALVITIIVLLILATVSIAMLTGENGILNKSQQTKTEQIKAELEEKFKLAMYELRIEKEEKPIKLEDITVDSLQSKIKDSEIEINVELKEADSENGIKAFSERKMASLEETSETKYIEIRLTKCEVTVMFKIDQNLSITKVDGGIEISEPSYNVEDLVGDEIEVTIYVRDTENGINQIMIDGEKVGSFNEGSKDRIEIKYKVKLGQSYKMTIVPTKGKAKEETILINVMHQITTNLAEGLHIDNELTEIQHNQSYTAKITEDDEYLIDGLTVKMGEEVLTEGIDLSNGTIQIEKVTGDITITATAKPCPHLLEFNSVRCYVNNLGEIQNPAIVQEVLFNGNNDEIAPYRGVYVEPGSGTNFLEFTVYKKLKVFAYGKPTITGVDWNGKRLCLSKWNGSSWDFHSLTNLNHSGNWYELFTLNPGRYRCDKGSIYGAAVFR